MTNEEKAKNLASEYSHWVEGCKTLGDYYGNSFMEIEGKLIKMAKWKDEELKKDILELEAKNDVLNSCLRDAKSEIERLRHKIVELLNEKKPNMKTIDCNKPTQKDGGEKMNMCGECKWFSCDDRGRCICTKKEWGNWKASPYVGACFNYFERKEEEK